MIFPPPIDTTTRNEPLVDDRFRLTTFLEKLAEADDLTIIETPVALADVAGILEKNSKAVLFRSVGPEAQRLVGNVAGSRSRLARAFGATPETLLSEALRRLDRPQPVIEVGRDDAPAQSVVRLGEDADLTTLPVHLQHGLDGAPYICSSIDFVLDPSTGETNIGMRRLMLRDRREAGVDLVAPSDLRSIYETIAKRGEPLAVAFVVGSNPVDQLAATARLQAKDLDLIAALRERPLHVVKCITSDIRVPADAEYVIEGYFDARGHVEPEGPYGEFLGYYGGVKRNPVFHVTCITSRRDPIFQTSTIGGRAMEQTDTAQLIALRTEITLWKALESAVREPIAVHAAPAAGGSLNVRIALRQRAPGESRNAIAAAFGSLANVKHVFVVDPDIDIESDSQMEWALATRFQADRDFVVQSRMRTLPLDPSLQNAITGAKAGFDCTFALRESGSIELKIPEAPKISTARRRSSVEEALSEGAQTFEELMNALGSRDGREIVRALGELRQAGRLGRDEIGRWTLTNNAGGQSS
jgi:2,5-furandicarboxylate decarboxylase 1